MAAPRAIKRQADLPEFPALSKRTRFSIDDLLCAASCAPVEKEQEEEVVEEREEEEKEQAEEQQEECSSVVCRLEGAELWAKFHDLGTEMIITKSGRRMFPTVKVSLSNTDPLSLYYVYLDVVPVDNKRYRYIYNKSSWLTAGKAEPAPRNRLYLHPDSPFTSEQLQKQVISFEKAKLTNNEVDKTGHLILNSMHKYQPRVHIMRTSRGEPFDPLSATLAHPHSTHAFEQTQFMAVTAYQNQLITKLKIEKNPFAKGFRDPSGRSPDYENDREPPPMSFPHTAAFYNPALFQQALFNQFWLGKSRLPAPPALSPHLLQQLLLATPLRLPDAPPLSATPPSVTPTKEEVVTTED